LALVGDLLLRFPDDDKELRTWRRGEGRVGEATETEATGTRGVDGSFSFIKFLRADMSWFLAATCGANDWQMSQYSVSVSVSSSTKRSNGSFGSDLREQEEFTLVRALERFPSTESLPQGQTDLLGSEMEEKVRSGRRGQVRKSNLDEVLCQDEQKKTSLNWLNNRSLRYSHSLKELRCQTVSKSTQLTQLRWMKESRSSLERAKKELDISSRERETNLSVL
jgi:hypothetical protein